MSLRRLNIIVFLSHTYPVSRDVIVASVMSVVLIAIFSSTFVFAEGVTGSKPHEAVARLNYAEPRRLSHCTAFAIAPRIVVTATHCLVGGRRGEIHVLFGYNRMEWHAHIQADGFRDLGNDIALVRLKSDAPAVLLIGETPSSDAGALSIGYGQPLDQIQNTLDCLVEHVMRHHVRLDCPASKGQSGAPVMNEQGRVFGVMVQTSAASSVVALLPDELKMLLSSD